MSVVVLGAPANIVLEDSSNIDAFSRLRVSNPVTVFDSKQIIDNQPLVWDDQQTSGSGTSSTYITNQASSKMSVSNLTAGTRIRQTFERFNYQPGKSLLIVMTGLLGAAATGIIRRIGYFNGKDGLFFELSGSTLNVVIRTYTSGSVVDNAIPQSSWNIDKLDGTGTSGITLNTAKVQIFVIDFQWLGVGRVRFGFDIGGVIVYCHEVLHANIDTMVYMSNPNLPFKYEISNDGTGAAADLYHICSCAISEGGKDDTGFVLSTDTGITGLTTLNNASLYPLIAVRLKTTAQAATVDISDINVINTSSDSFRYVLLLNPTVVGTALSFSDITNSALQTASTSTNATTVTGGTQLTSGYGVGTTKNNAGINSSIRTTLRIGASIAGVSDIIVLAAQRISGTTSTFFGSMDWLERI